MTVITRFAPSPTGNLHIGSARTALFAWLFARAQGGKFYLRIEDTDLERSKDEYTDNILDGLKWLGLDYDGDLVYQSKRFDRYREVVQKLIDTGHAYYCYLTPEEIDQEREIEQAKGLMWKYDGRWRDRDPSTAPAGVKPVVRFKAQTEGTISFHDHIQGDLEIPATQLDDLIILRADGSPTYNLSVVVDDHDMAITHVIRGDDHLTNTFRQLDIYRALNWTFPEVAHVPLILGTEGGKLSKRDGAMAVTDYREQGVLPQAFLNYLMRLGWSHGDHEIITLEQAKEWFTLKGIGKSPARFDLEKLYFLNTHYIHHADPKDLLQAALPFFARKPNEIQTQRLHLAMDEIKKRATTLREVADVSALFQRERPITADEQARALITVDAKSVIEKLIPSLEVLESWEEATIKATIQTFLDAHSLKMGALGPLLRIALIGTTQSPNVFNMVYAFGKEETQARLKEFIK